MVDGIQELVEALQINTAEPSKTYHAEVSRIDNEGRVWVYLEGGTMETPTSTSSAEVKAGDYVNVEWRNNKLYIAGNTSNPSAGVERVSTVERNLKGTNKLVKVVEFIAESASKIATSINQYFWHVESGTADNGAHITQIPKEEFLADPENGGGNLLATSNGIAVRDGLTELATFDSEGLDVYKNGTGVAHFGTDIRLGTSATNFTLTADATTGNYSMVCKRSNVVKGRLSVTSNHLSLETNGTGTFTQSGGVTLQSEIGSGNTRYGAVDISARRANGVEYNVRVSPTGLTASAIAKVLWSGASYMSGGQSADLSEAVSEQLNGVVLVWSRYANSTAQNDSWSYDFVPKWHTIYHDGGGVYCSMPTGTKTNTVCNKYVYVYDMSVEGHADNTATGTGYANNTRVLRAVLGV